MKYKVTVYLNRIPDSYHFMEDFEKARLYHSKHGVEITWSFRGIDVKGYTTLWVQKGSGGRYILQNFEKLFEKDQNADVNMFVIDEAEWATPPGSPFPLKPEVPCGMCVTLEGKPFIVAPTYPSDHVSGITWVMLAHEIMHSLVQNANLKGFNIMDVMDTYRENQNPDSPTGNFAQQWELLKPFLSVPEPFTVTLERKSDDGVQTLGELSVGDFNCKTLELAYKWNYASVSCIPKGTYNVKWTFSLKYMRYMYEVLNVPDRSGIRIHSGNYWYDSKGCILLGDAYADINKDGKVDVVNSRATILNFESLMNKKDFRLIIK